ncbi:MAG: transcriptional regulator, AraC family [Herbinix sp.]|jgi:AraC family L-rhamnose operon regulatory protein RhaS|nr:transcriptional regulator, AraC family [Herbinix sp.]
MSYCTIGFNYYIGYLFSAKVTEGLCGLTDKAAGDFYKIIYIKSGSSHFVMNGKEFILTGASTICMNEKDEINFYHIDENVVRILWFHPQVINATFSIDIMNDTARKLTLTEQQDLYYMLQFLPGAAPTLKILSLHTIDSALIEHKLTLLKELLTKQDTNYWPCRSRSYLLEILFCLARQEEEEEINDLLHYDAYSRLAVDVIYYLQSSYSQKITVERLADEFHTNRTSLLNNFKKYTGQSVNQYLIQLRLTMSSTLLRDTELSIEEICERTGFSDISYFSKVFKKKLNHTPSEYRKLYNKALH